MIGAMAAPIEPKIKGPRNARRKTGAALAAIVFASLTLVAGKRAYEYAAAPTREKDCDFVFPEPGGPPPTAIAAGAVDQPVALVQRGGTINDASCLNKTAIHGIVLVSSIDDVRNALRFARERNLKVTSAGQRHSMGGQSFSRHGLVLDMRGLDGLALDTEKRLLTVQAGATWEKVQQYLDKQGLAVKAMQSINIFTVGGTLSVNAHGVAHRPGPIAPTVRSIRVMLADGEVKTASAHENPALFRHVLGGYGLFGVILDAEIEVVANEMYRSERASVGYRDFPAHYRKHIDGNRGIGLMYARLSVAPTSYLEEVVVHTYEKISYDGELPPLQPEGHTWLSRLVINFSKTGGFGRWVRWMVEKYAEPYVHICLPRNQAMSRREACLVSRNQEMYDSMKYLKNTLADTDILQEYFIPRERMPAFVDGLRVIVRETGANLLNVTVRIVEKDDITALPYAKEDMFAFVLYFNQRLNEQDSKVLQRTTSDLIDLALGLDGRFYLPYQLSYSPEQLHKAYPEIASFFSTKKKVDPTGLFSNTFYEKYGT